MVYFVCIFFTFSDSHMYHELYTIVIKKKKRIQNVIIWLSNYINSFSLMLFWTSSMVQALWSWGFKQVLDWLMPWTSSAAYVHNVQPMRPSPPTPLRTWHTRHVIHPLSNMHAVHFTRHVQRSYFRHVSRAFKSCACRGAVGKVWSAGHR